MTKIETVQELLLRGEIVDVRYLKLSADALEEPRENFEPDTVEQSLQVQFGNDDRAIEVRVEVTVKTRVADYAVTGAVQFHVEEGATVPDELVAEFAEKVGVMAVYPYVREAIQSLTARLHEAPVTIPLMRQAKLSSSAKKKRKPSGARQK